MTGCLLRVRRIMDILWPVWWKTLFLAIRLCVAITLSARADCQWFPSIENIVEKELGTKNKKDIEEWESASSMIKISRQGDDICQRMGESDQPSRPLGGLTMLIRPWIWIIWKASGGPLSSYGTRDWFIKIIAPCTSVRAVKRPYLPVGSNRRI